MLGKRRSFEVQSNVPEECKESKDSSNIIHFSWKGILFAILTSFCYSTDAVIVKSIKLDPIQITLYRFIILFVMCIPDCVKYGKNPFGPRDVRFYLLLRGALGGINMYLAYTSFQLLPLGKSFIISSSQPFIVTFCACIFLKEPCGIVQSILVIFTVIGILLTTNIMNRLMGENFIYTTENIYGTLAAVGALLCRVMMVLSIRLSKKADHTVMMFNYCWVSLIECLIFFPVLSDFKWHACGTQWIYILLIGIISYFGQTFLSLAYKCEFAGPVATIIAGVQIVLAYFWQTFVFYDIPDYFTIAGAVIVSICIILTTIRSFVSALPKNSSLRQRWRWLTV